MNDYLIIISFALGFNLARNSPEWNALITACISFLFVHFFFKLVFYLWGKSVSKKSIAHL